MDRVKFSPRPRLRTDLPARLELALCLLAFGLLLCTTGAAQEAEGAATVEANALLDRFAAEITDLEAEFEQLNFDEDGELVDEPAHGRFLLLRPDRFLWHQYTPFEQKNVADGEYLWSYDVDLEQVTRAPLAEFASSPWMLLSGQGDVGDDYRVVMLPSTDDNDWIELAPLDEVSSEFTSVRIAFADSVPVALEIHYGLGDFSRIDFSAVEVNPGLDDSEFEFEPPAGVHVVAADD